MLNLGCGAMLAGGDDAAIAVFVMGGVVAVISIVTHHWRKHREVAYNARLKQLMIERGMSADEIERVVQATPGELAHVAKRGCGRASL